MTELTTEVLNNFLIKTYFEKIEEPIYAKSEINEDLDSEDYTIKNYFDENGILRKTTIEDFEKTLEQVELYDKNGDLIYKAGYEYIFEPKNAIMIVKISKTEMEETVYSIPDLLIISKTKRSL